MYENPSAGKFDPPPGLERQFEPPPDAEASRARRRRALLLLAILVLSSWPVRDWLFSSLGPWASILGAVAVFALAVLNWAVQRQQDEETNPNLPYTEHQRITR
jgi:hypothetical protein